MHIFIRSEMIVRQAGGIFFVVCLCVTSVYLRVIEYFMPAAGSHWLIKRVMIGSHTTLIREYLHTHQT